MPPLPNDPITLGIGAAPELAAVQQMLRPCIQCGTCTASCPNEFAMDLTPRHLWRLVLTGQSQAVFQAGTFALCSACYCCTLRCPRGLPLTEAMAALKQVAARRGLASYRRSHGFHHAFLHSVRRHGRVQEMVFMLHYFAQLKNPLEPLRFTPLGLKLLVRGKLPLHRPPKASVPLEKLFRKAAELEASAATRSE